MSFADIYPLILICKHNFDLLCIRNIIIDILYLMKIKLAKNQLDKLSDLSLGLGQLFFGSLVVP